jgi:site-specific DNA-methyltransferase (adenine-specific)
MSIEEIKNLRVNGRLVRDITDRDSFLFLWITFPQLEKAFEVIRAWGFTYKTLGFNWVKKNKAGGNFIGMGWYTRSNAEVCLIATKGHVSVLNHSISSIVESIPQRHSAKPIIVRDLIVKLCGRLPRIELFAREKTRGWHAWGFDVRK